MTLAMTSTSYRASGARRLFAVAAAIICLGSAAHAATFSESTLGDFSNTGSAPTSVGFSSGSNIVTGLTGGFDSDFITFNIAPGQELSSLVVLDGSPAPDRIFIAIASGDTLYVNPNFSSAAGLIGWSLFSDAMDNTNILGDIGLSAPANFPSIPGATGFTPPLGAGTYTAWIVDGDGTAGTIRYALDFAVSGAPEPSVWALMIAGVAIMGGALRSSRDRRQGSALRA